MSFLRLPVGRQENRNPEFLDYYWHSTVASGPGLHITQPLSATNIFYLFKNPTDLSSILLNNPHKSLLDETNFLRG
jgi:hypothetical protein